MTKTDNESQEDDTPKRAIGPTTPIQLGVLVTLLATIFTGGWALSSMNTKIDMVLKLQTEQAGKQDGLAKSLSDHVQEDNREWNGIKSRVLTLETVGSPQVREVDKRLSQLEARLDVHERVTAIKP